MPRNEGTASPQAHQGHIAIMAPNCSAGSVGSVAWRHAIELSRWFHVHVLSADMPVPPNDHIHAIRLNPFRWDFLRRYCHVPNALALEWTARRHLRALCRRVPITTVWCHGHAGVVLAASPLRRRHGFRVIMTTHGDIRDRPAGTYSREMTWYYRLVTPPAYRWSDVVHAISPYMADLAQRGGARRVEVIPHGVDPEDIGLNEFPERKADTYCPDGIVRLLFVGNLLPIKGVATLLEAVKQTDSASTDSPVFTLTIVGEGHTRAEYERYVRDNGIESSVRFLGHIPRKELGRLYMASDLLCVPSQSEPFGLVAIEGMACGLPVVGSRVGGLSWLIEDGNTGRLVESGDPAGLAAAIKEISRSRDRLAAMGQTAREHAVQRFSWPVMSEKLRTLAIQAVPL